MKVDLHKIGNIKSITPLVTAVAATVPALKNISQKATNNNSLEFSSDASEALKNQIIASQKVNISQDFKIPENRKIYVLSGSSGVGKDTLLRAFLAKHSDFKLSVSCTTRQKREGEVDGEDYIFLSPLEFQHEIENGEFLEWADFSGNRYGTRKQTVLNNLEKYNNIILKLDTVGALKIKKLIPQAELIFVAPPSLAELESRLRKRNTETEEAIQKRLGAIKNEMENSKRFDHIIVNDTIDIAVANLENLLCSQEYNV